MEGSGDQECSDAHDLSSSQPAESTYPGPGLRAHRVHFDVFRNSPLIGHFLDRAYAGRYQRRSIKIHRAEVERDLRDLLPPPTATNTADDTRQTYRAIVLDSDRRARHNARTFHNHNDTLTRDRVKITVEQAQEARAIERVTGRILARAVDVREISDQICDLHMSGVNEDASVKMKRFAEKSVLEVEKEATRVARRRAATIERRKSLMLK